MSTCNQPIEEVVITTKLVCRTVSRCGSDTVLFGLSKSLTYIGSKDIKMYQTVPDQTYIQIYYVRSIFDFKAIADIQPSSAI